jgi:dolichyl-phosphate beta-glucosyltransferase
MVSVVIPTYNEEKVISNTLIKIQKHLELDRVSYEIIVVDDGSTDSTVCIVEQLIRENKNNKLMLLRNMSRCGKGAAIRKGLLNASGKYVFFCDADLSTPIEEIDQFLKWLGAGYDIVIGSRRLPESEITGSQPYTRTLARYFFQCLAKIVIRGFSDTQCGFKGFTREAAKNIFSRQKIDGYAFDVEVLYIAKKLNYKVKELPVKWVYSPFSKLKVFSDSIRMVKDILRIKLAHRFKDKTEENCE